MILHDNGHDYHILINAAKNIKGVPGMTCEIGLREGGGTKYIIDALVAVEDDWRTHISIDPYGNLEFQMSETSLGRADYTNRMRNRAISELFAYIERLPVNVIFFNLGDDEFFKRFPDGVPVYREKKRLEDKYALVYFDGPHNLEITRAEAEFFKDRVNPGSIFIFDDVTGYYDHNSLANNLKDWGFSLFEEAMHKKSYRKN